MNLANKLTLFRLVLVPVFLVFTITDNVWTRCFALFIFITASLTDLYDGYFARKYGLVTDFGKLMDPLADKFLTAAAFISFVSIRELNVPAWMVVLIIGRELLVTGLRVLAASKGEIISADAFGKAKTASQIAAVIAILVILCVNSVLNHFYSFDPSRLLERTGGAYWAGRTLSAAPYWLVFLATVLTLVSGFSYLVKNRHVFARDVGL